MRIIVEHRKPQPVAPQAGDENIRLPPLRSLRQRCKKLGNMRNLQEVLRTL